MRRVLGEHRLQHELELFGGCRVELAVELGQVTADFLQRFRRTCEAFDARVGCFSAIGLEVLEFLVKFFPWAEPDVFDFDITAWLETGKGYHLVGEICDLDWFPHVENEDFATGALGAALQHKAHRLGYGHEESYDVRVSYSDRSAIGDLAFEDRDDTAGGAEYI